MRSMVNTSCGLSSAPGLFVWDVKAITAICSSLQLPYSGSNDPQCLSLLSAAVSIELGASLHGMTLCGSVVLRTMLEIIGA